MRLTESEYAYLDEIAQMYNLSKNKLLKKTVLDEPIRFRLYKDIFTHIYGLNQVLGKLIGLLKLLFSRPERSALHARLQPLMAKLLEMKAHLSNFLKSYA